MAQATAIVGQWAFWLTFARFSVASTPPQALLDFHSLADPLDLSRPDVDLADRLRKDGRDRVVFRRPQQSIRLWSDATIVEPGQRLSDFSDEAI